MRRLVAAMPFRMEVEPVESPAGEHFTMASAVDPLGRTLFAVPMSHN